MEPAAHRLRPGRPGQRLAELNRLFTAWAETVYHVRPHTGTGAPPLRRWAEGIPVPLPLPSPAQLREAFLWSQYRTVTKSRTARHHFCAQS